MADEGLPDLAREVQEIVEKYHARGEEIRRLRRRINELERGLAEIERRLVRLLEWLEKEDTGEEAKH
jgi:polyhydroxyalkanoate synthesis regulator phasin